MPSSIIGGIISSNSQDDALDAQTAANDKALAVQKQMYDQSRADLEPYRTTGYVANDRLAYLMGLSPTSAISGNTAYNPDDIASRLGIIKQSSVATGGSPAPLSFNDWRIKNGYGGEEFRGERDKWNNYVSSFPNWENFANTGIPAGQFAPLSAGENASGYYGGGTETPISYSPSDQARIDAEIARLRGVDTATAQNDPAYGSLAKSFTLSDFIASPDYQFRKDEGNKALDATASRRGNFYSGRALKEAADYNNNLAANEYGASYTRFNKDKDTLYSRLAGISNTGMGATNNVVDLNSANADTTGSLANNLGSIRGSAAINQGEIFSQGLAGLLGGGRSSYGGEVAGNFFKNPNSFSFSAAANGLPWSDIRLKHNIKPVGVENGHKIYEFNYNGNNKRYRGVMAQEVQKTNPDAVCEQDGYLAVDYGKIGVDFREVA